MRFLYIWSKIRLGRGRVGVYTRNITSRKIAHLFLPFHMCCKGYNRGKKEPSGPHPGLL
jgi:hypothetical protein